MAREVLDLLQLKPGGIYVDATVGLGGHSQAILERIQPGGLLIGIDRDKESLEKAQVRLKPFAESLRLFHDNYKNLPLILNNLAIRPVDGILDRSGSVLLSAPLAGTRLQLSIGCHAGYAHGPHAAMDRGGPGQHHVRRANWQTLFTVMARSGFRAASPRPSSRNAKRRRSPAALSWQRSSAVFIESAAIRRFIRRPGRSRPCESL